MARDLGVPYTDKQPFYFISYNSEDQDRIIEYVSALAEYKFPMWYDKGLIVGSEFETEIAQKIDDCEAVIMFLSKKIFDKKESYVHKEFELATEYSNKEVFVIMLDRIEKPEVPIRFRSWWTNVTKLQCINTYDYTSASECIKRFAESIGFSPAESHGLTETNSVGRSDTSTLSSDLPGGLVRVDNNEKDSEALIVKRVKIAIQSRGLEYDAILGDYAEWLEEHPELCKSDAYEECIKPLIRLSRTLVDMKMMSAPLYGMRTSAKLNKIIASIKNNKKLADTYVILSGIPAIETYCRFVSEVVEDVFCKLVIVLKKHGKLL